MRVNHREFFCVISLLAAKYFVFSVTTLWGITPCSPLKVNRRFRGTCRLHLVQSFPPTFTLVFSLAYSSALKMELTCSSETSIDYQRTTRRYIPEDINLYIKRWFCIVNHFPLGICRDSTSIMPRPLPSKSFPNHTSPIINSFGAT
jgi:hypothetical protein